MECPLLKLSADQGCVSPQVSFPKLSDLSQPLLFLFPVTISNLECLVL